MVGEVPSAWKEGPKEEGIAMNSLFKLSLAALAMSGIVGLGPNLASARDTKHCEGYWNHCLKSNQHHSKYPPHKHGWRDYDQRW
jgi:hypothetical protein